MTIEKTAVPIRHDDRFFIGGSWVEPSSSDVINVIDSATEELYFSVPEAKESDMARAVDAAREAFDRGPWPKMSHAQRAEYLRAIGEGLRGKADEVGQLWPRESGALHIIAQHTAARDGGRLRLLRRSRRRPIPFEERASRPWAASSACSSASRSAWSGRSSRGTRPSASSPTRSPPHCSPGAPSSSSPRPRRRATPTSSPRSPRTSACRLASSTS